MHAASPHPLPTPACQAYEARRAARDAEREAQEAAQEEEIRRAAEERARREEEEAQKWMHLFSVEAAGQEALSQEESAVSAARGWAGGCAMGAGWRSWRADQDSWRQTRVVGGRPACTNATSLYHRNQPGHQLCHAPLAAQRRRCRRGLWTTSRRARRWGWTSWRPSSA